MADIPSTENDTVFRWSAPQACALTQHFDTHGPRYASYPTIDRLHNGFGNPNYLSALHHHVVIAPVLHALPLLYMCLPSCANLCYYCDYDKIITKDRSCSTHYVETPTCEMAMVASQTGPSHCVTQLRWGGGTLTFLAYDEMRAMMATTCEHFDSVTGGEISVELDSRRADNATLKVLAETDSNRVGLGIQDFDPNIQRAVHCIQSVEKTRRVVGTACRLGFESISFDLIYGLPCQCTETFSTMLDHVLEMAFDRLPVYSCAHLSHLFKAQCRIDMFTLSTADEKLDLLATTVERFVAEGHVHIGMDHLARPDSALVTAQHEEQLQRNLQGYSTHVSCGILTFGVSTISRTGNVYAQNEKDLDAYYVRIDADELAVLHDMLLTSDDHVYHTLIGKLMCGFELNMHASGTCHGLDFKRSFADGLRALAPLKEAGLVKIGDEHITITP